MNRKWLGCVAALVFVLSACDKGNPIEEDTVIRFNGQISSLKADRLPIEPQSNWLTGDRIGIFMLEKGTSTLVASNSNRQYVFNGNQFNPVAGAELYYPLNDSKVDFVAYFPYLSTASWDTPLVVNVSNQSNQSNLDLLYVKSDNNGAGFNKTSGTSVPLIFSHALSKIIIKPAAGNGLSNTATSWSSMNVTIKGMNTISSFDLASGDLNVATDVADVIPFTKTAGVAYEAIVLPHVFAATGALKFSFLIDGETYVWNSAANETLEPGKEYTYTITINKTGVVLNNVTITDWETVTRTGIAN